eukprot:m.200234 g.200234  ORF g.200234 m.200234 type:complete len:813 (-) comp10100_c0_seq30:1294-3732(-)
MDPPLWPFVAQTPLQAARHAFQAWMQMLAQYPNEPSRHFVQWTIIQRLEGEVAAFQAERTVSQHEIQTLRYELETLRHELEALQHELETLQHDLGAARALIPNASTKIILSQITRVEDPQHPPKPLALLGDRRRRDILMGVYENVQTFIRDGVSPVYALKLRSLVLDCIVDEQPWPRPLVIVSTEAHPDGTILSDRQCEKFMAKYPDPDEVRENKMATAERLERVLQDCPVATVPGMRRALGEGMPSTAAMQAVHRENRTCVAIHTAVDSRGYQYAFRLPRDLLNELIEIPSFRDISVVGETAFILLQEDGGRLERERRLGDHFIKGFVTVCMKGVKCFSTEPWPHPPHPHTNPPDFTDNVEKLHPLLIGYGPEEHRLVDEQVTAIVADLEALKTDGLEYQGRRLNIHFCGSQDFVFSTMDNGLNEDLLMSDFRCMYCPLSRAEINNVNNFLRYVIRRQRYDPHNAEAWLAEPGRERPPLCIARVVDTCDQIPDTLHVTGRAIITTLILPIQEKSRISHADQERIKEVLRGIPGLSKFSLSVDHTDERVLLDRMHVNELRLVLAHFNIWDAMHPTTPEEAEATATLEVLVFMVAELLHGLHVDEGDDHYLDPPRFAAKCELIEVLLTKRHGMLELTPTLHILLNHVVQFLMIHGTIYQFSDQALEQLIGVVRRQDDRHVCPNEARDGPRSEQVMRHFNQVLSAAVSRVDEQLAKRPYNYHTRPHAEEHHWIPRNEALLSAQAAARLAQYRHWETVLHIAARTVYNAEMAQAPHTAPGAAPEPICARTGRVVPAMMHAIRDARMALAAQPGSV